jgi:hypothetical protein
VRGQVPARPSTGATVKMSQVPGRSHSPLWTATARSGRWLTSPDARDTVGYHLLVDLVRVGRVVRALVVAAVASSLAVTSACGGDPALPVDDTGRGNTDELDEALALHDLRLPTDASDITYTVHTSIDSHSVGLRFRTTPDGLDEVLASIGRSRLDLQDGLNPWEAPSRLSSHSPERFGWDLAGIASSAGLEVRSDSSLGATGVLADLGDQAAPVVYVETLNCC